MTNFNMTTPHNPTSGPVQPRHGSNQASRPESFTKQEEIGRGSFAVVYKAIHTVS